LATEELADSTREKYRFVLKRFTAYLDSQGLTNVREITPDVVNDYLAERAEDVHPTKKTRIGREGLKSDQRVLHAIMNHAVEQELIDKNPVKGKRLNTRSGEVVPFTDEEVERMLKWAEDREGGAGRPLNLAGIIWLFLNTGLRLSDVVNFPKSAIRGDWIALVTKKRKKLVRLPLLPSTKEALERWTQSFNAEQSKSPWLFPTRTGRPMQNLDGVLRRLWRRAGIEGGHAHRFRHTFAVRMLRNGAQLYDVAQALGITVAVCVKHYAPFVSELEQRVQRLVGTLETVGDNEA
jgi:integrase/recombinase XerD